MARQRSPAAVRLVADDDMFGGTNYRRTGPVLVSIAQNENGAAQIAPLRFMNVAPSEHAQQSRRTRAGVDDGPDIFAAERRGQPAGYESVHDLHALDVPRVGHDIEECRVDLQRASARCELGRGRFADELRRGSAVTMWIGVTHTVDVLHDVSPAAPSAPATRNAPVSAR